MAEEVDATSSSSATGAWPAYAAICSAASRTGWPITRRAASTSPTPV